MTEAQLEEKKKVLHEEIGQWGRKLEEVQALHAEYTITKEEIDSIKGVLESKKKELSGVISMINDIKKQESAERAFIDAIRIERISEENKLKEIKSSITAAEADQSAVRLSIDQKKHEFSLLEAASAEKISFLKSTNAAIAKQDKIRTERESDVKVLECSIADLEAKNKMTEDQYQESLTNVDKKFDEIVELENRKSQLNSEIDRIESTFDSKKEIQDLRLSKEASEISNRELKIADREGKVSLRENYLDDKEKTLREYKTMIEKSTGKSIGIII